MFLVSVTCQGLLVHQRSKAQFLHQPSTIFFGIIFLTLIMRFISKVLVGKITRGITRPLVVKGCCIGSIRESSYSTVNHPLK